MQVYANMESLKKLDALESFETEELKVKLRKQNDADNHLHFWLILCISKESLKFNTYFMTLIRKEPHQPTCFFRLISSGQTRSVTLQWIDVIRTRPDTRAWRYSFSDLSLALWDLSIALWDLSLARWELSLALPDLSLALSDLSPALSDLSPALSNLSPALSDLSLALSDQWPI